MGSCLTFDTQYHWSSHKITIHNALFSIIRSSWWYSSPYCNCNFSSFTAIFNTSGHHAHCVQNRLDLFYKNRLDLFYKNRLDLLYIIYTFVQFKAMTSHLNSVKFDPNLNDSVKKQLRPTGWAKLNGTNAVSFVIVKHVLENFDNFWQVK